MLYEIKLKVVKTLDDGQQKEVKEHYICDAELHGEAETIGYNLYPGQTVDVVAVFRSDVREIINNPEDGELCFKATVVDVYTDGNGKEKELKYPMLLFANNFNEATQLANEYLKQGYDMTLDSVKRIKILDYIKHE